MYEVQSTKYQVPPFDILQSALDIRHWFQFRISYFVSLTFYPYLVLSTLYLLFDIRKS